MHPVLVGTGAFEMSKTIKKVNIPFYCYREMSTHFENRGSEAIGFALCSKAVRENDVYLFMKKFMPISYENTDSSPQYVKWKFKDMMPTIQEAVDNGLCIIKVHSHPNGFNNFSETDNNSDKELFPAIYELTDEDSYHVSMIFLKNKSLISRYVDSEGTFKDIPKIIVPDDDIKIFHREEFVGTSSNFQRTAQAFGSLTVQKLQKLKVAVVGASGTGDPTVTQLIRNGVGDIVIIDPKESRQVNMNRMSHLKASDVMTKKPKADVLRDHAISTGLNVKVKSIVKDVGDEEVIKELSTCDIFVGCMDSVRGRHILNKISSSYCVPFFDIGVQLKADGYGGISSMWASYFYIKPGGPSLYSQKVYTMDKLQAETIKFDDPDHYKDLQKNDYIVNVDESAPAVISVNNIIAGLCVLDILGRIHPFRDESNSKFNSYRFNYCEYEPEFIEDHEPCSLFLKSVSEGDEISLLRNSKGSKLNQYYSEDMNAKSTEKTV